MSACGAVVINGALSGVGRETRAVADASGGRDPRGKADHKEAKQHCARG